MRQLQKNLIALHLLLKEEEEEEDVENHANNWMGSSGGVSTPPPLLNAKAQSFIGSGTSMASLGELEPSSQARRRQMRIIYGTCLRSWNSPKSARFDTMTLNSQLARRPLRTESVEAALGKYF